jgi:tetratricopeptide (TPR) repeat protein
MMNVHRPASRSLDFEQGIQNQQPFSSNGISHLERRDSNASLKSSNSIAILNKSHSSANVHRSDGLSTFLRKELEEQLGDTLYKRAQAKLMIEADPVNIEAALTDVMKAINHYSEDDDYYLVAATCYIRLQRYSDAMQILEGVLDRSPNNYKALYNLAFCRRAEGSQKDAIEGLTKVITLIEFLFSLSIIILWLPFVDYCV